MLALGKLRPEAVHVLAGGIRVKLGVKLSVGMRNLRGLGSEVAGDVLRGRLCCPGARQIF
jgi:hypothetical protein